jgi:hypothetical protein
MDGIGDVRAVVDDPGGEQNAPRAGPPIAEPHGEAVVVDLDRIDPDTLTHRTIFLRLSEHRREQIGASDTFGIAGVVVRAGDQRRAAAAAIEQPDREVEPREVDRRRQPCRPRADDDAIVHWPRAFRERNCSATPIRIGDGANPAFG